MVRDARPLDYRVFGILKSFARQEFMRLMRIDSFDATDKAAARYWLAAGTGSAVTRYRALGDVFHHEVTKQINRPNRLFSRYGPK